MCVNKMLQDKLLSVQGRKGHAVAKVFEALRYHLEDLGFDYRCRH